MENTQHPATYIAYTPSGPTTCCLRHARQIVAVFSNMCASVRLEPIDPGRQCDNCLNEAKKAEARC